MIDDGLGGLDLENTGAMDDMFTNESDRDGGKERRHGFDRRGLNETDGVKHSPLLIDNKEVYYQGFLALSEEDKARVLLGHLLLLKNEPDVNNLETEEEKTEVYSRWKDKELFGLKKWGFITIGSILSISIVGLVVTYLYFGLKSGVLDSEGLLTGLLSAAQEVFRVLFSSPTEL